MLLVNSMKAQQEKAPVAPWLHFLAGGLGGCCGTFFTCPLDVLRTQRQSTARVVLDSPQKWGKSTLSALKSIHKTEGVAGLFRGLGPSIVGVAPARALYFGIYNYGKNVFGYSLAEGPGLHLTSAGFAGICVATITSPIWVVKTRVQLQRASGTYDTVQSCIKGMWRAEGIRSFYRGLSASYYGVSEGALQFTVYEHLKKTLQERTDINTFNTYARGCCYFGIASFSKLFASFVTYPHEVVRTRLREPFTVKPKYTGFWNCMVSIAKEEGRAGLYGGMGAHLLRVVPNAAIMFLVYEMVVESYQFFVSRV